MRKNLLAGSPPFTQLIMLLFCMVTCSLLFTFIGILLAPVFGIPIAELMTTQYGGEANQNLRLMRYMQTLQGINFFIIPAFFAAYLFSGNAINYLRLTQSASAKWYGAVFLLMLAALPCINLMAAANELIVFPKILSGLEQQFKAYEEAARNTSKLFLEVDSVGGMFFNIFMIALIAAVGEELIFRGVMQKILVRWTGSIHAGIIITGFLFSLMHLQFYGFFPRWLLGAMFGYLLVWSGTMWLPIFAHFVHNALAVFLSYLIHQGTIPEEIETFGTSLKEIPITIIAAIICVWIFWIMYRNRINTNTPQQAAII